MALILVLGLSGVGKTFVCSKAVDILKRSKKSFEIVNYGDVIGKVMNKDPDLFRAITNKKEYSKIQLKAAKRIVRDYKNKNILLTTHGIMDTRYGLVFGVPPRVLKILNPDLILVLWMSPNKIFAHVKKYKGRGNRKFREEFNLEHIKLMQELEKSVSITYGFANDCPVKFVENIEGRVDEVSKEISNSILEIIK